MTAATDNATDTPSEDAQTVHEARLWRDNGWTAQVMKNEDDDGWAVAMYKQGHDEPALVGPWTMGRDKKNPKPLDTNAFNTLVKTASEVIRRHEQHVQATLNKEITVTVGEQRITVKLAITPDDDNPSAQLSACDECGDELARVAAAPSFKLDRRSAEAWVASSYARPR